MRQQDQLEHEARQQSRTLEAGGKLPHGFTDHHYPLTSTERLELHRLNTAWRLTQDLDALRDLLLGIPLSPNRLDQTAVDEALTASLVQLVRPIDLLHGQVA